ncbi:MAG: sigma 54-interacting transcriptional regulator [Victivallales bacterium]|nr:sigma 54-interacting transcriptional regulator [Victivallales bacterium]
MSTNRNHRTEPRSKVPIEAILESISDGVFTVDPDWRVTSFNRAAAEILGIPREEAIGRPCAEIFRSNMCQTSCALRQTLATGLPVINRLCYIIDSDGNRHPISVSTAVLRAADGSIIGGAETFRDLSEVEELRKKLEGRVQIGDFISHSPAMRQVFDLVHAVSSSVSTVLIQGDTGTGKELLARAIHSLSPRASHPFVAVNCGALPDTLLESELFGYKKGAFTGAAQDKPGRFALAKGGTLFLDEIGEISPALQVRLLRVIQEHCYVPLGGTKSESTDVRIIAATNRDLRAMVKTGDFREDLFYRINVVRIEVPPLVQRKEDIPLLVEHFIARFNRQQHRNISGIAPEAQSLLMAHNWPGNVRELENVIERAFVLCTGSCIAPCHLPEELYPPSGPPASLAVTAHSNMQTAIQTAERQTIVNALQHNGYNRAQTARELGIHPTTLFRKMKALDIAFRKKSEFRTQD